MSPISIDMARFQIVKMTGDITATDEGEVGGTSGILATKREMVYTFFCLARGELRVRQKLSDAVTSLPISLSLSPYTLSFCCWSIQSLFLFSLPLYFSTCSAEMQGQKR